MSLKDDPLAGVRGGVVGEICIGGGEPFVEMLLLCEVCDISDNSSADVHCCKLFFDSYAQAGDVNDMSRWACKVTVS